MNFPIIFYTRWMVAHIIPDLAGKASALNTGMDCETQERRAVFKK